MSFLLKLLLYSALCIIGVFSQEELWKNIHLSEIFYIPCGEDKACIQASRCAAGKVNRDGRKILHIRLGDNGCDHYLDTCCSVNDTVESRSTLTNIGQVSEKCGQHNKKGVSVILQDAPKGITQFGEFPWMIAILKDGQMLCGGVLITKSVVLTVAHCVYSTLAEQLIARAGEWDTNTEKEPLKHEDAKVSKIILHENYNNEDENFFFDIAMLVLNQAFELKPHINTICLPENQTNFSNANCFVTGWGKDKFGKDGIPQVFLKKIELSVVQNDVCVSQLRNTVLGKYFDLHESFLCAGGEAGYDACEGDGGAPLVCKIPGTVNTYQLAGLVAWGIECGLQDVPGVYVNVPYLRQWVKENLKSTIKS